MVKIEIQLSTEHLQITLLQRLSIIASDMDVAINCSVFDFELSLCFIVDNYIFSRVWISFYCKSMRKLILSTFKYKSISFCVVLQYNTDEEEWIENLNWFSKTADIFYN